MAEAPKSPLRQVRVAAGITIRELERRTGINRGRLSIIERGVTPSDDEAKAIYEALQRPTAQGEA